MSLYAERAYFDGDACAHCAARDEYLRLHRNRNRAADAIGERSYSRQWR